MSTIIVLLGLVVVFFSAQEVLRKSPRLLVLGLFGITTLALTPFWLQTNDFDLFWWFKIYSILGCVCWGSWLRLTSHGSKLWCRTTFAVLLAANIAEAMCVDVLAAGPTHRLNALSGMILIMTLPYGARHAQFDSNHDMRFDTSLNWIVGYTLWNWTFVYLNYPALIGHHTAILAVALLVGIIDPQRWLQTRAITLGLNLIAMATSYAGTLAVNDASGWYNYEISIVAATVSLSWIVFHLPALSFSTRFESSCFSTQKIRKSNHKALAALLP